MSTRTLNHFTFFTFTDQFWSLSEDQRREFFPQWDTDLQGVASCTHFYQVSPIRADTDALLWSALPLEAEADSAGFFDRLAKNLNARRVWLRPTLTLWGFTRPSQYSRAPSAQEMDPFAAQRKPYLVIYPFVKTVGWYLMGRDTRQGMMNEHIRIGHQYPEIMQLLLYSFGLQDQEFVVVYETADLVQFSTLVNDLRGSEARRYTERDTPIFTATWHSAQEMAALYG